MLLISLVAALAAPLTQAEVQADLDLLDEALTRLHPGLARHGAESVVRAHWEQVSLDVPADGMSHADLFLAVQWGLARIGCDHTSASSREDLGQAYLPFLFEVVQGRARVVSVPSTSSLRPGDELLAVDGRTIAERIEAVSPFMAVDGDAVWSVEPGLGFDWGGSGGAIEHIGAWQDAPPEQAELQVRRGDEHLTLTVDRVDRDAWKAQLAAHDTGEFKDSVALDIDGTTAVLTVGSFVNYRNPIDADELFDELFGQIRDAGVDHLIVDLRDNGGGSHDAMFPLLAHLIEEPTRVYSEMAVNTLDTSGLREHLWSWDKRVLKPPRLAFRKGDDGRWWMRRWATRDLRPVRPDRLAYTGPLTVLTGPMNSSGSTVLIAKLLDLGRARTVGSRTGGSADGPTAGVLVYLTLPNSGIRAGIPLVRFYTALDGDLAGWLEPTVAVQTTFEDRQAGTDPVLDAAQRLGTNP